MDIERYGLEATTAEIATGGRAYAQVYDTTIDGMKYLKYSATGYDIRNLLTLDSTYNTLYGLGNIQISDSKYIGLGASKGRIQFDDETKDTVSILDANVGIGTSTPNTSSALDITSTTGALLLPRMTTTQRDALTPANGMLIYNTTLNKFQGYENSTWMNLTLAT